MKYINKFFDWIIDNQYDLLVYAMLASIPIELMWNVVKAMR